MIISVIYSTILLIKSPELGSRNRFPSWVIPILCLAGIGVSFYLTYVETTQTPAFCGPVGDCNSVQQSPYATLWGVLPVGILGLLGYIAIGLVWGFSQYSKGYIKDYSGIIMWGLALVGTLFSIYLTFLEPFVIGATCIWCITSAIIITLLLWASTEPAIRASARLAEIDEDQEVELEESI
jgi:uncharacterized membrane protein